MDQDNFVINFTPKMNSVEVATEVETEDINNRLLAYKRFIQNESVTHLPMEVTLFLCGAPYVWIFTLMVFHERELIDLLWENEDNTNVFSLTLTSIVIYVFGIFACLLVIYNISCMYKIA